MDIDRYIDIKKRDYELYILNKSHYNLTFLHRCGCFKSLFYLPLEFDGINSAAQAWEILFRLPNFPVIHQFSELYEVPSLNTSI